eukprot:TRINITY_DN5022_c0_g1_i3.p1 TRINITY_DN5022_c0_g1~~TRINITY_DN5022_c0_g1_i3.p1  ORF type:complete len:358 (+),score=50.93 TRINITY_DN5022_c0_g1_i3:95-1168(+)
MTVLHAVTLLIVAAHAVPPKSLQTSSDAGVRAAIASDTVRDGSSEPGCSLELRQLRREEHRPEKRRGGGLAWQTPTAAVTFVKFHQVGGTSAAHALKERLIAKQAAKDNHVTTIWHGHPSLAAAAVWAKAGSVPDDTFAITLLRHPVEKYLSSFFKHEFPSVQHHGEVEYYRPSPIFDNLFGPGANRSLEAMQNLSAVQEAIRTVLRGSDSCMTPPAIDGLSWGTSNHVGCEYTRRLGDKRLSGAHRAEAAIALLQQFAVVGITERFDDWEQSTCAGLGDLATVDCSAGVKDAAAEDTTLTKRESLGHPRMADFPDHFVDELRKYLEFDMAVYREAQRLAEFGPRQHIRLARHVPSV